MNTHTKLWSRSSFGLANRQGSKEHEVAIVVGWVEVERNEQKSHEGSLFQAAATARQQGECSDHQQDSVEQGLRSAKVKRCVRTHSASGANLMLWRSVRSAEKSGSKASTLRRPTLLVLGSVGVVPDLLSCQAHPRAAETEHRRGQNNQCDHTSRGTKTSAQSRPLTGPPLCQRRQALLPQQMIERRTTPGAPGKRVPPWRERTDETAIGDQGAA